MLDMSWCDFPDLLCWPWTFINIICESNETTMAVSIWRRCAQIVATKSDCYCESRRMCNLGAGERSTRRMDTTSVTIRTGFARFGVSQQDVTRKWQWCATPAERNLFVSQNTYVPQSQMVPNVLHQPSRLRACLPKQKNRRDYLLACLLPPKNTFDLYTQASTVKDFNKFLEAASLTP